MHDDASGTEAAAALPTDLYRLYSCNPYSSTSALQDDLDSWFATSASSMAAGQEARLASELAHLTLLAPAAPVAKYAQGDPASPSKDFGTSAERAAYTRFMRVPPPPDAPPPQLPPPPPTETFRSPKREYSPGSRSPSGSPHEDRGANGGGHHSHHSGHHRKRSRTGTGGSTGGKPPPKYSPFTPVIHPDHGRRYDTVDDVWSGFPQGCKLRQNNTRLM